MPRPARAALPCAHPCSWPRGAVRSGDEVLLVDGDRTRRVSFDRPLAAAFDQGSRRLVTGEGRRAALVSRWVSVYGEQIMVTPQS